MSSSLITYNQQNFLYFEIKNYLNWTSIKADKSLINGQRYNPNVILPNNCDNLLNSFIYIINHSNIGRGVLKAIICEKTLSSLRCKGIEELFPYHMINKNNIKIPQQWCYKLNCNCVKYINERSKKCASINERENFMFLQLLITEININDRLNLENIIIEKYPTCCVINFCKLLKITPCGENIILSKLSFILCLMILNIMNDCEEIINNIKERLNFNNNKVNVIKIIKKINEFGKFQFCGLAVLLCRACSWLINNNLKGLTECFPGKCIINQYNGKIVKMYSNYNNNVINIDGGTIENTKYNYEISIYDMNILQLNLQETYKKGIGINRMLIHLLVYNISLNKKQCFEDIVYGEQCNHNICNKPLREWFEINNDYDLLILETLTIRNNNDIKIVIYINNNILGMLITRRILCNFQKYYFKNPYECYKCATKRANKININIVF